MSADSSRYRARLGRGAPVLTVKVRDSEVG